MLRDDKVKMVNHITLKKSCGLLLMLKQPELSKLTSLIPTYATAYVFVGDHLFYVDKQLKTCAQIDRSKADVDSLKAELKLGKLIPESDGHPKRYGKELSLSQLNLITHYTGHTIPLITLEDVLHDMLNEPHTYDGWQGYLEGQINDASLYYFVLGLDVNAIIDAASYQPSKHNLPAEILEAARIKLDAVVNHIKIPQQADRAYLFCLLEVYRRIRQQGPEYESWSASFFPELSKEARLQFCKLYKEFIVSDYRLNQFDDFLKSRHLSDKKKKILSGTIKSIHDFTKQRGIDLEKETAILYEQASGSRILNF